MDTSFLTRRWRLKRPRQQGHFYPLSRVLGLSALILAFVSFGTLADCLTLQVTGFT